MRTTRFLETTPSLFSHLKLHIATILDIIMEVSQASKDKTHPWFPRRTYLIEIHHWENQGSDVSCLTTKTKDNKSKPQ